MLVERRSTPSATRARPRPRERGRAPCASPAPPAEPARGRSLRELGIRVEPGADLDVDPGPAEIAYLDVWTPEVAPRVARPACPGHARLVPRRPPARAMGRADDRRSPAAPGKTTTTALTASLLRAAGIDPAVISGARAGNLWPTPDLLDRTRARQTAPLLIELTSSHLAFMATARRSPPSPGSGPTTSSSTAPSPPTAKRRR